MLDNLLSVTVAIVFFWVAAYAFYLYTSRQQQAIADELESLQKKLDARDRDERK